MRGDLAVGVRIGGEVFALPEQAAEAKDQRRQQDDPAAEPFPRWPLRADFLE